MADKILHIYILDTYFISIIHYLVLSSSYFTVLEVIIIFLITIFINCLLYFFKYSRFFVYRQTTSCIMTSLVLPVHYLHVYLIVIYQYRVICA
jgi:hypothetical protein